MRPFRIVTVTTGGGLLALIIFACSSSNRPGALGGEEGDSATSDAPSITPKKDSGVGDSATDASLPTTCSDTIKDGNETDVDCGGTTCAHCYDGKSCLLGTDCFGGACTGNVCATPQCADTTKNGDESDVDCGGSVCARCTIGKKCVANTDCGSEICSGTGFCECPNRMVQIDEASAGGGSYCIDQTEVTSADYAAFLAVNWPISQQITECATANTAFLPTADWPPSPPPSYGDAFPVRNVDWCDARAYCVWAGKELCGKVGGGSDTAADVATAMTDAWYNACSSQGAKDYPYGNTYETTACVVSGYEDASTACGPVAQYSDAGAFQAIPVGFPYNTCVGGPANLYQMSGNVAEWADTCTGDTSTDTCLVRGGSFAANGDFTQVRCDSVKQEARMTTAVDVGIRCCEH